ncbi:MAG: long-chain fatty acid--CoA ligase [bacterium]
MNPGHIAYLVDRNARKYPTKTALCNQKKRVDYLQLRSMVLSLTGAFASLGITCGDRVATLLFNGVELVVAYLALFRLGAVLVPLNTRLAEPEWRYMLEDSGAVALLSEEAFAPCLEPLRESLQGPREVICIGAGGKNIRAWEELASFPAMEEPPQEPHLEQDLYILYTSGTTGRPKGAVITHMNFLWNAVNGQVSGGFSGSDVVYYGLPLFHGAAMGGCFATLLLGGTVVLRPRFDPMELLGLIQEEKITRVPAVPPMLTALMEIPNLEKWDLSSLRTFNTGATIIPQALKERLLERFPWVDVVDSYGLTEATSYCTTLPGKDFLRKNACVGKPHAYVEVRVVDEKDQDVPVGEVGEILVRGPNVMRGYWNRPYETAEALKGGWLHTGDLGKLDNEGYLYIVDRKKDMIISGGENIYPREVEEVLSLHPGVQEASVVGFPDPRWGEKVVAYIVGAKTCTPSSEELQIHCRKWLAGYKCPKEYFFVNELPRTPTGKVLKRALREGQNPSQGQKNKV